MGEWGKKVAAQTGIRTQNFSRQNLSCTLNSLPTSFRRGDSLNTLFKVTPSLGADMNWVKHAKFSTKIGISRAASAALWELVSRALVSIFSWPVLQHCSVGLTSANAQSVQLANPQGWNCSNPVARLPWMNQQTMGSNYCARTIYWRHTWHWTQAHNNRDPSCLR